MLLINQQVFAAKTPITQDPNKVPIKTIDQLLTHNSDTAVKPIIGNKEIEKTNIEQALVFDKAVLPFNPWTLD